MKSKLVKLNNIAYFQCDICKLLYKRKVLAQKCSEWCKKNKSCNLEITKHAVKVKLKN